MEISASGHMPEDQSNCSSQSNPLLGDTLTLRHARQLINAEAFAASKGCPLNTHITVHLSLSEDFSEEAWSAFHTNLLDMACRWLRYRGIPVAYAWVRENGPVKGPHLHLMLHLPHEHWRDFKLYLLKVGRFQVADASGEAIRISGGAFGMQVPTMRAGVLRYILKDLGEDKARATLGIRHQPSLSVNLKRAGVSHTISQKARREAGWREMTKRVELRAHLHPTKAEAHHAA